MPFLHETTYDLGPGQFEPFQTWLRQNEDALAAAYPEGVEYVGTYSAVFGDESRGAYKMLIKLDSYGVLDAINVEVAREGELGRLLWEISAFTQGGPNSRGRAELWKRAAELVPTRS